MPYNLLTFINTYKSQLYHYIYKTSIDGSIFFLYYLYCLSIFQRTCCFRLKSGCKGKRLYFNYEMFSEVFLAFLFRYRFSDSLCERERRYERITIPIFFANRTAKIRTFSFIIQTLSEVFLFLFLSRILAFTLSQFVKAFFSWKAGAKVAPFQIRSKLISNYFF